MKTVVVRGFGYNVTHAATIIETSIEPMSWPSPAYPFEGIRSPVASRCGITVRSVQPCVIIMKKDTPVSCRVCRALIKRR